jgi:hypothetical protein
MRARKGLSGVEVRYTMKPEVTDIMQVLHLRQLSTAGAYRLGGRSLLILGALFWIVYGLLTQASPAGVEGVAIPMVVPGLVLAALLAVAWKWELIGGIALLSWALLAAVYYPLYFGSRPPEEILFTTAALSLPPLLGGFLFLAAWGGERE